MTHKNTRTATLTATLFTSLIFYGPPGVGKTSLARVIAHSTSSRFVSFSISWRPSA